MCSRLVLRNFEKNEKVKKKTEMGSGLFLQEKEIPNGYSRQYFEALIKLLKK